jgi:hypothetical protein
VTGATGAAGATGPSTGGTGQTGQTGAAGPAGSPAAGASVTHFFGDSGSATYTPGADDFMAASGESAPSSIGATHYFEGFSTASATAKDLYVEIPGTGSLAGTYKIFLWNWDGTSSISCSVTGSLPATCNTGAGTLAIGPKQRVYVEIRQTVSDAGADSPFEIKFGWEATTP